jgi:hypothetical protein
MRRKQSYFRIKKEGKFGSPLEKFCYESLTEAGIPFEFQSRTFVLTEAFTYDADCYEKSKKVFKKVGTRVRKMTYTPDFVGTSWIIETKGMRTEAFNLKWKLFKNLTKESPYLLLMPTNQKEVLECINLINEAALR